MISLVFYNFFQGFAYPEFNITFGTRNNTLILSLPAQIHEQLIEEQPVSEGTQSMLFLKYTIDISESEERQRRELTLNLPINYAIDGFIQDLYFICNYLHCPILFFWGIDENRQVNLLRMEEAIDKIAILIQNSRSTPQETNSPLPPIFRTPHFFASPTTDPSEPNPEEENRNDRSLFFP